MKIKQLFCFHDWINLETFICSSSSIFRNSKVMRGVVYYLVKLDGETFKVLSEHKDNRITNRFCWKCKKYDTRATRWLIEQNEIVEKRLRRLDDIDKAVEEFRRHV